MNLAVARQEWHLARKHYQQVLRDWHILPRETRSERLNAAQRRRQDAFDRYLKSLRAA